MVKIIITDAQLQVIKIESNGTVTDNLVWQTPQGFPAISSKGSIMAASILPPPPLPPFARRSP